MPKQTPAQTEARRDDILHRCVECFAAKGFHQTSMRDLCATLDMSPGGLYTYFDSKEAIITAFIERDRAQLQAMFREVPMDMPFVDAIGALDVAADQIVHGPGSKVGRAVWMQISAEASINPKLRQDMAKHYDFLTSQLEKLALAAQERGELKRDLDAHALAMMLLCTFDGLVMRQSFQPRLDRRAHVAFVQSVLRAFVTTPKKGGRP
jgi:TetR/AcrR family transcriptional regulator, repressor for uid operon